MNGEPFHIIISHIPFIGIGFCLPLFLLSALIKNVSAQRIALFFVVLTMLLTGIVFLTGRDIDDTPTKFTDEQKILIEDHHTSANISLVMVLIAGLASLGGLIKKIKSDGYPKWYILLISLLLIFALALSYGTVNIGLSITH